MAKQNRYQAYRGRSNRSGPLKVLVIVLAVVLLVLAAIFFWLQNYMVYTPDGVRLELPFGLYHPPAPPPPTPPPNSRW
jgi:uncharacterized RDD family membrane protein YckC